MTQHPQKAASAKNVVVLGVVACALLAGVITVAVVVWREDPKASSAVSPSASSTSPEPIAPTSTSPKVVSYDDTKPMQGSLTLRKAFAAHAAADSASPVVVQIPAGSTVELRGARGAYTQVIWASEGQNWLGWIDVDPSKLAEAGDIKKGRIEGIVRFEGVAPVMEVPKDRHHNDHCKSKAIPLDDVVIKDGKLQDVFVVVQSSRIFGYYPHPSTPAVVDQVDCMYKPKIQGVMVGQEVEIRNSDPTLHNVHLIQNGEKISNMAQPKGADPLVKVFARAGIIHLTCDMDPWMRGYLVITTHPFFAVTGEDGAFAIDQIPTGRYALEAWHARYGLKRITVVVGESPVETEFTYQESDWVKEPSDEEWGKE